MHISGAEGIFEEGSVESACRKYLARAMEHPRGKPDTVVITVEHIRQSPSRAALLPVHTVECKSVGQAEGIINDYLAKLGISARARIAAMRLLRRAKSMRGAAVLDSSSGKRLDPDHDRGVRVSRIGIAPGTDRSLRRRLASRGINTETVREALTLASKVAASSGIIAEVCISDDPDYTTGYLSSDRTGYVRIASIKDPGSLSGGRVFFALPGTDINRLMEYLELQPVIISNTE